MQKNIFFKVKGMGKTIYTSMKNGTIEIVSNDEVGFRVNLTFPLFKSIEKKV